MSKNKLIASRYALFVVMSYLIFTYVAYLLLYELNSIILLLFMLSIYISIIFGYLLAKRNKIYLKNEPSLRVIKFLIIFSAIVTIIFSINFVFVYYNDVNDLVYYLFRPGQAYEYIKHIYRYNLVEEVPGLLGSRYLSIFLTLLSGTKYILIVFSIIYWKKLNPLIKFISIVALFSYIVYSFLIGAMINIAVIFMSLTPLLLFSKKGIGYKKNKKLYYIMISSVIIVFVFMHNRIGYGQPLSYTFNVLIDYVAHGYYGLELSFKIPFEPTFGFTSLRGISTYLVKYLNFPDLFQQSYLIRVENIYGYPALSRWSTIFPWLASDFTYFIVPIIFISISKVFFNLIRKVSQTLNPFGILLLGQFFIFWFMVPANNQLFHTLSNMSALIMISGLYIFNNKEKVKVND